MIDMCLEGADVRVAGTPHGAVRGKEPFIFILVKKGGMIFIVSILDVREPGWIYLAYVTAGSCGFGVYVVGVKNQRSTLCVCVWAEPGCSSSREAKIR